MEKVQLMKLRELQQFWAKIYMDPEFREIALYENDFDPKFIERVEDFCKSMESKRENEESN